MQHDRFATARLWLENARTDLDLAIEISERFAARACFHAQQCSEFALKGALIALADDHPRTHVGAALLGEIAELGRSVPDDVAVAANKLDLFYVGSRYPDALGGADPRKVLTSDDARSAVAIARIVLDFSRELVG